MISGAGSVLAAYGLCAVMFVFAVVLRLRSGSWSNPSVVFALFWGAMTLLPIYFVPQIRPSVQAIGYITAAVLAFGLPVFVLDWRGALDAASGRRANASPFLSGNQALVILILVQATVLAFMAANVAYQGFSARDFLVDPFGIGCEYLGYRYRGDVRPFLPAQAGTILNYVAAGFSGLIVAHRRSILLNGFVVLLCILPSLYSVAVYADKGTIFLTLAFFFGAVVAGRIRGGNTALLTWRTAAALPLILLVVAAAIGLALLNRTSDACEARQTAELLSEAVAAAGDAGTAGAGSEAVAAAEDAGTVSGANGGLGFFARSYAFGHLFAFSSWFDHWLAGGPTLPEHTEPDPEFVPQWNGSDAESLFRNPQAPTYGFWTFMSVGKLVDRAYFASLPEGYYEEYFLRPGLIQTNIYTFFRGLIYDFTLPGSLAALALFGLVFNLAYRRMLSAVHTPLAQSLYIFFAGYLYTSYIISLLIWNSVIASGIATFVMLAVIDYVDRRGGSLIDVLTLRHLRSSPEKGAK